MEAFTAAMTHAAAWFNDPKNFDELVKIYTPIISFGDMAGADEMRRNWIKSVIPAYSKDLKVKVSALQEIMDFSLENKIIDVKVEAKRVLWEKAPQTPGYDAGLSERANHEYGHEPNADESQRHRSKACAGL